MASSGICLLSLMAAVLAILCSDVNADFCTPNPCGPNTECKISAKGIPTCHCKDTYYGDDPIKEGCKRECEQNNDCKGSRKCLDFLCVECLEHSDCSKGSRRSCFAHRCIDLCKEVKCGAGASCEVTPEHRALCTCPTGSSGNALDGC